MYYGSIVLWWLLYIDIDQNLYRLFLLLKAVSILISLINCISININLCHFYVFYFNYVIGTAMSFRKWKCIYTAILFLLTVGDILHLWKFWEIASACLRHCQRGWDGVLVNTLHAGYMGNGWVNRVTVRKKKWSTVNIF